MNKTAMHVWLEQLVQERVSPQLALQVIGRCIRIFCAEADSGFIELPIREWRIGKAVKDCAFFDAKSEGWPCPMGKPLLAPGVGCLPSPLIEKINEGYVIHYDLLGMAFWMLARLEEIDRNDLDIHGRFPATASHAFIYGYLERPVVDEWFVILRQVANRLWPRLSLVEPKFQIFVSHDVDRPSRYALQSPRHVVRAIGGDVLKRRYFMSLIRGPLIWVKSRHTLHQDDPYNTFDWIMDTSEKHGLTSVFNFMSGCTEPSYDGRYQIGHPAIRNLLNRIHERGHKIGLHPSYNTYQSPDLITHEMHSLHRVCADEGIKQSEWGGRMHYLRWETPATLRALTRAGLTYDSTLGFADRPGFRCGTCFEYPAFDPIEGRVLPLRLRPLIAMECTVMGEQYCGLVSMDTAYTKFLQLKNACRAVGGLFVLLWHNSALRSREQRELYETVLRN